MSILDDLLGLVAGSFHGLPTLAVMVLPFVAGLLVGIIIKKILKIGLIIAAIAIVASYFGFINLSDAAREAKSLVSRYGPEITNYMSLTIGILPLGLGFFVGFAIGLLFG